MSDLEAQMAAEAARAEAARLAAEAAATQALKDAQAALDQSGVSIPPGACAASRSILALRGKRRGCANSGTL